MTLEIVRLNIGAVGIKHVDDMYYQLTQLLNILLIMYDQINLFLTLVSENIMLLNKNAIFKYHHIKINSGFLKYK